MAELTRKEEQILLAVHFLKEDASLIRIRERVYRYTGKRYSVGTIYAPLNRLDLQGYLEVRMEKTPDSKKPVKYYRLSPKGYDALETLRKQTETMWAGYAPPAHEKGGAP